MPPESTSILPPVPEAGVFHTGEIAVQQRAGERAIARVLSLRGTAALEFDDEDRHHPTGGTGRYWSFTMERWVEFSLPSTMRWTLIERSPFNPVSSPF
jgi:hypothetical protein